ncbi:protease complex subunit PrcB family protein [Desulfurivibrio sp. D14AmB]|uniref:protease complex subunit PrcB family protein n=1 Tax=Desulfurivibrio sp. D14AmB TaxID=3374370 RepID=UPI00376F0163
MKTLLVLVAAVGGMLLAGCATVARESLGVEVLFAGGQCGGSTAHPALTLIERQAQLDSFYVRQASFGAPPPAAPRLDFSHQLALLIEMGQRPTGGYGLALAEPTAALEKGRLELRLDWQEPPPGLAQTQALTSPCLLLALPAGDYRQITIRDRQGRIRLAR